MSNFSFSSDIKISTKKLNKDEKILIVDGFKRAYGLGVSENFILIPDFETGLIYQVNLIKNKTKILFRDKDNLKYLNFFQKFKKNKLGKQIVQPHDIIIDENSNIYISQMGPGRGSGEGKVTIFDENFKLKKELGLKMHNNYGLISPVMISKNNDKFYISEYGAHKILRFSEKFEFLDWIGQKSEIDEKIKNNSWDLSKQFINVDLNSPHAIKIGPNNNLYIADTDNHRILRYSNSGQFRGWIGKNQNGEINSNWNTDGIAAKGEELGAFNKPCDLVIYENFLYVSEIDNSRVVKIALDGKNHGILSLDKTNMIYHWSTNQENKIHLTNPYGLKIKDNVFYIADRGNNRIKIIYSSNLFK